MGEKNYNSVCIDHYTARWHSPKPTATFMLQLFNRAPLRILRLVRGTEETDMATDINPLTVFMDNIRFEWKTFS